MKRTVIAVAAMGLAWPAIGAAQQVAAPSMTVRTFLAKVAKLKQQGALAIVSPDLEVVKTAARTAALALKQESDAREAAGKPPIACPPKGTRIGSGDFLKALESIPPAERDIGLKQGFARVLAKRYPCGKRA